ncbi:hypothetical protein LCGC14_2117680, partial [marine sediment metagenome]
MKVSELIALLQEQSPDAQVVVDSYEEGYDPITNVDVRPLVRASCKARWTGMYLDHRDTDDATGEERVSRQITTYIFSKYRNSDVLD